MNFCKRLLPLILLTSPAFSQTNIARMNSGINSPTVSPYLATCADSVKLLSINSASAFIVTLPAPTTCGAGVIFQIKNNGLGTVTVSPLSGTIDGVATLTLLTGGGADIYSDGTNYITNKGAGGTDNAIFKGPNPWADVSRFGGYFGPQNPPFTTGAITSGTPALVLANAQDFANGQGVLVLGAGPASSLSTPTGVQAAPWGVVGSTTYNYCVVAEDYLGGRTACSAAGASTTSAATLGIQSATISSCNRVAGLVTCTTTGNHNFTAGAQVNIVKNSTGDTTHGFEGVFSILTTPTATTFTYTQYGALDVSGTVTTGTAQVNATNLVRWNSDSTNTVLRSHVYRCAASCGAIGPNYAYAGTVVGVDGYFQDYGIAVIVASNGNGDVPATAPTTATNTALSTTILSGGGTTSLTLANNAGATVAAATVLHDNSPNLVAACSSFTRGGIVYIPTSNVAANYFHIRSPFKLSSCPVGTQLQVNSKIWATAPIIMAGGRNIQGLPGGRDVSVASPAFYDVRPQALFMGFAYPFIYIPPTANGISLDDLLIGCYQTYQPCIYQEESTTGGGIAGARFRNVHVISTTGNNTTWVVKNGFGLFWEYGGWGNGATSFASPPAMLFSPNCGLSNTAQQQAYGVTMQYTYGFGTVFDACNQSVPVGLNNYAIHDMISESAFGPMFRFANTGGIGTFNGNIAGWEMTRAGSADSLAGIATPVVDATMTQLITGLRFISPGAPQVLLETNNVSAINGVDVSADFINIVGAPNYTISGAGTFYNYPAKASGALGHFAYQMALPSPPQGAIVSAGGSVPIGAHSYQVAAVDYSGNETTLSTGITATTTGGNQTVTVTLPATFPAGAKGVNVYRDGVRAQFAACPLPQFTTPGGTYVDTFAITCSNSPTTVNNAGSSLLDANGVTTQKILATVGSTVDLSRATTFLPPSSAGFVSSTTAQFGYDPTLANFKGWNGVDSIFAPVPASLSIATNDVVTWTNAGGSWSLNKSTPVGLGASLLMCDGVPSANNGDIFRINNSGHCATATPGIPGRVVTNSGTLSGADLVVCTSGTGDRGGTIIFTNASAVVETLPNPATGACGSNFNVRLYWQGAAGGTLKATTATVNGIAGATGIVIPGNTWVDVISHDNVNYDVFIARGIKCGTNLTEVLNADGTVTCNAAAGGTPRWDQIISATATNTTANGNFPQILNFAQTTDSQAGVTVGETSAATGGTLTSGIANQSELKCATLTNSTAACLNVVQGPITNTVATPAGQIQCTWNNGSLAGQCLVVSVTNTASSAANSRIFNLLGGASGVTPEFGIGPTGNVFPAGIINIASGVVAMQGSTSSVGVTIIGGQDNSSTTQATLTLRGSNNSNGSGTSASNVVIQGGGMTGAATNVAGADVSIAGGLGTGTSAPSHVIIKTPGFGAASGTTAQSSVTRFVVHSKAGSTTTATATNMFNIALANNQTAGARIHVHVETTQATPQNCSTSSEFFIAAQDTAGTVTTNVSSAVGTATICSTGTLTLTLAASAAAPTVISVTPSWTTIVPTAVIITVGIENLSQQDVALL